MVHGFGSSSPTSMLVVRILEGNYSGLANHAQGFFYLIRWF